MTLKLPDLIEKMFLYVFSLPVHEQGGEPRPRPPAVSVEHDESLEPVAVVRHGADLLNGHVDLK